MVVTVLANHNSQLSVEYVYTDLSRIIECHYLVLCILPPATAFALSLLSSYDLDETLNRRWIQHDSDRGTERLRREVTSKLCPHDARVA